MSNLPKNFKYLDFTKLKETFILKNRVFNLVFMVFVLHIPADLYRVSPQARMIEIFCVAWFLQPLQESKHATFDTLFSTKIFQTLTKYIFTFSANEMQVRLIARFMGYQNIQKKA